MAHHSNFSSSSNSSLVNYRTTNLGVSSDPYTHHSSVTRPRQIPHIYTHGGSYYNQLEIRGSTSASNSQAEYQRAYFKRKSSAHPMVLDARNSNEYYSARSSIGLTIPSESDQYMRNAIIVPRAMPHSSINGPSTIICQGSESHRNVRSRHGHALHLENNSVGSHPSRSLSHHLHQTTSASDHAAMPMDSGRRFPSSGFFHHEMNQPIESSGGAMEDVRHRASLVPTLPAIPIQADFNYGHRVNPYSSSSTYATMGLPGAMEDVRQFGNEVLPHLRHHSHSSMVGQSAERYGRTRRFYDRLSYRMNTPANEGHAHGRWNSEDAMIIDSSVFNDPHAMFDQHRNMRMDIDNMSYEELIDLGERIGNVSTGLSGGDIARCLTGLTYSFDRNKDAEEGSCVICLEEYKDGQSIGRLNCRHDFHSRCIKKWLLIKNACPICKSAALGEKVKGKQVLLM